MTPAIRTLSFVLAASLPVAAGAAEPAPQPNSPRLGLHLGVEHFKWKESDPNQPSRELLEESGPRLAGTVTFDNFLKPDEGLVYALKGRLYYGEVDYDGETQAGVPLRTDVEYAGTLAEGRAGYRFPLTWAGMGLDVLGGLGGEYWSRDIHDGYDANGNKAQGYQEEYTVAYARAGLALADLSYAEWFGRLEAGARYPLDVQERIDDFDADLSPGSKISLYASYEISRTTAAGHQVGVTFYYDSYRFKESPSASSSLGLVRQPKSDMDVFGLRLGWFL
ncbi:MAG TPA: hypothetical protein VKA55_01560 [Gammaproteobacteria bacterium]|nr:hypothetical protein [Gammaproteobacteria bacterium]